MPIGIHILIIPELTISRFFLTHPKLGHTSSKNHRLGRKNLGPLNKMNDTLLLEESIFNN